MRQTATLNQDSIHVAAIEQVHQATALYTTVSVVDQMLTRANWPDRGGRMLDPSSGDGAFLIRGLERLAPAPGDYENALRVQGYEFHAGAVAEGRGRVKDCLVGMGWSEGQAWTAAQQIVEQRDFLLDAPKQGLFSLIIGNPPYLRFARLPQLFKVMYGEVVARHALGDLMHAFIDRCCMILTQDGAVGLVTADRWLVNETAANLRAAIGCRVSLAHVSRLDVTSSFYRAKTRRAGTLPRVHPVEVLLHPAAAGARAITSAPISPDGTDLDDPNGPTLKDICTVRVAPWLGPAGIFVVDEGRSAELAGHAQMLKAVDTDDIDPHTDALGVPKRYAIFTRRDTEPTGALRTHLLVETPRMPERGRRGPYWMPPETINVPIDRPTLLVPRIARRLRVIDLPAGVVPINHNLSLVASSDLVSLDELRALLLSQDTQEWIARYASRLEKGFLSITTSLIRRLPLPGHLACRLPHLAGVMG